MDAASLPAIFKVQFVKLMVCGPTQLKAIPFAETLKVQLVAETVFPLAVANLTMDAVLVVPLTVNVAFERINFVAASVIPLPVFAYMMGALPVTT